MISSIGMRMLVLLLFISSFERVACQNIVDFSHSQYLHNKKQGDKNIKVKITSTFNQKGYEFPTVCNILDKLTTDSLEDMSDQVEEDSDGYLDGLKIRFIQMLKVAQKLKGKKNNLENLGRLNYRETNSSLILSQQEIKLLKSYESKLTTLSSEISEKTAQVQSLVFDSMNEDDKSPLMGSALNYQIQSLRMKIQYLTKTLAGLKQQPTDKDGKKEYEQYFNSLRQKFQDQNDLTDDLNNILVNYDEIKALKQKIATLNNKIDISNLMIEEKEGCRKQILEIRRNQQNQAQIKALMSNLREKKKDQNNQNNQYCQGVTKKLLIRLRNVLLSYDITFECADGYEDLKQQYYRDLQTLQNLKNKLKELEDNVKLDDYKSSFESNRKYINSKKMQLNKFSIPEYQHNKQSIQDLLYKSRNDLDLALKKKNFIGTHTSDDDAHKDYSRIKKLVQQIKVLKSKYCHEYERYQYKSQELWSKVNKYEADLEYQQKINAITQQQINEMISLEMELQKYKTQILAKLQ